MEDPGCGAEERKQKEDVVDGLLEKADYEEQRAGLQCHSGNFLLSLN